MDPFNVIPLIYAEQETVVPLYFYVNISKYTVSLQ